MRAARASMLGENGVGEEGRPAVDDAAAESGEKESISMPSSSIPSSTAAEVVSIGAEASNSCELSWSSDDERAREADDGVFGSSEEEGSREGDEMRLAGWSEASPLCGITRLEARLGLRWMPAARAGREEAESSGVAAGSGERGVT